MDEPRPAESPTETARELGATMKAAADDLRVVLRDRAATARVRIGEVWHEDVPIVTARVHDDAEKVLRSVRENAVLLKEQATHAWVRVNDEVHAQAPIFKERVKEGAHGAVEEIRVRVREIRERVPKAEGAPFWARFAKKKEK